MAPARHALTAPQLAPRHELARKALHLATGAIPVAYALGTPQPALEIVLGASAALALAIEGMRRANATIDDAMRRSVGPLMREYERRGITGATWLALSAFVAVSVLSRQAAIAALWCVTVGDPAATIAGRWIAGRSASRRPGGGKTVAGSLACAATSFAGVWMVAGYTPVAALGIAVAATLAERIPVRLDDNIRVAAAAGVVAQFLA